MSDIIVDVDGLLADLHTEWMVNRYNKDYDDDLRVCDITQWGLHNLVKPECGKKIYSYLEDPTIYDNTLPIPGALEGVNALRNADNVIMFVTTVVPGHAGRKKVWLKDHGFLCPKDVYIESANKGEYKAYAMIDDHEGNFKGFLGIKVLFTRPWNKSIEHSPRFDTWEQITNYILGKDQE